MIAFVHGHLFFYCEGAKNFTNFFVGCFKVTPEMPLKRRFFRGWGTGAVEPQIFVAKMEAHPLPNQRLWNVGYPLYLVS